MLAGLEVPTSGTIRIGDRVVNDIAPGKRDIAMVFQSYALYPHMTVAQNIEYPLKKRRIPKPERGPKGISPGAREVLQHYSWPGNVRELQNVIRRGVALARGEAIEVEDLPPRLVESAGGPAGGVSRSDAGELGAGFFELRTQRIAAFEREYLSRLLRDHEGDVAAAAKTAQIPRGTYYRLLKNHDLKPADFRDG